MYEFQIWHDDLICCGTWNKRVSNSLVTFRINFPCKRLNDCIYVCTRRGFVMNMPRELWVSGSNITKNLLSVCINRWQAMRDTYVMLRQSWWVCYIMLCYVISEPEKNKCNILTFCNKYTEIVATDSVVTSIVTTISSYKNGKWKAIAILILTR